MRGGAGPRRDIGAEPSLDFMSSLGGSWDLVSKDISYLIRVISTYKYGYLVYNTSY